jgi:hypothetical protein
MPTQPMLKEFQLTAIDFETPTESKTRACHLVRVEMAILKNTLTLLYILTAFTLGLPAQTQVYLGPKKATPA